jgi:antitoxin HicB
MKPGNPRIGSNFEQFLKQVIAWQFRQAMDAQAVSQAEMARRMKTSRAAVSRLLDADDPSITLSTLSRAANALGARLSIALQAPAGNSRQGRPNARRPAESKGAPPRRPLR